MVCVDGSMIETREQQRRRRLVELAPGTYRGLVPGAKPGRHRWSGATQTPPCHWYGLRSVVLQRGSFFEPAEPPSVTGHVVTISMAELVQIGAAGRTLRVQCWFLSTLVTRICYKLFRPRSQRNAILDSLTLSAVVLRT